MVNLKQRIMVITHDLVD